MCVYTLFGAAIGRAKLIGREKLRWSKHLAKHRGMCGDRQPPLQRCCEPRRCWCLVVHLLGCLWVILVDNLRDPIVACRILCKASGLAHVVRLMAAYQSLDRAKLSIP
jgi:hypothetical protein